ncbi:MAG: tetratricopeptide repeat protein [Sphingobacteriaceae bacterium]
MLSGSMLIMYKKGITILTLISFSILSLAQQTKSRQTAVGKVLSAADSLRVKEFFLDGLREKVIQNRALASDYFKRVIDLDPANDAAMYELASLYNAQNNNEDAEKLMQQATTINPNNFWYWILLEDIYAKIGNAVQLEWVYDQLIRLAPDDQAYYLAKAAILVDQNKLDEADRVYQEIGKRFGSSDELTKMRQQIYLQKGKSTKAISTLEKLIQGDPANVNNYVYLADVYTQLGNREKAIEILQKGKAIDPKNTLILLALADNYKDLNCFDEAFAALEVVFEKGDLSIDDQVRVLLGFLPLLRDASDFASLEDLAAVTTRAFPNDPKSYAIYGDVLFQEQKYPEALVSYKNALRLNSQVYEVWEQVLRIELSGDDFEQVIIDGESALVIFPNQVTLYLFTGIAYARVQQHEKAIEYLTSAVNLGSDNTQILDQLYAALGDSYNALKRYNESDQAFEKALAINPLNSYTLNNYAFYLALRGVALDKAEQMIQQAIILDPNNSSVEDTYAWVLFKQKKYNEARIWIEKAIQDNRVGSGTELEHCGDILYHLGEKQQALEQWRKAKAAGNKSYQLEKKINEQKYIE